MGAKLTVYPEISTVFLRYDYIFIPFSYRFINVTFLHDVPDYLCISFLIVCLIVLHSVPSGVGFFLSLPKH
jgi:hypothetical protein